ncbi:MAG TPA: PIN domain-containing protein [Vicinamibacterales bacterium]|nr:PIN domain-containing protein [Vicinamibacterales bacterium]
MRVRRLVDTSAWIELFRPVGDPAVRRAVEEATREGNAVLCDMVLLELWAGAGGAHERGLIARLASDVEILTTDAEVWKAAHALAGTCRAAGVTAPANDLLIAACAEHHGVELLERDAHFARIAAARKKGAK